MVQDIIVQLKKINWFDELSDEIVIALAQKFGKRELKKDEILFHKGDVGDSLFVILSGQVKVVTHGKDGNEIILNKVGTGEIIGEMSLLDNEKRSAGIVSLEKTSTLELRREDFMEILKVHPEMALSIIRNLSNRLRHNTSFIEQITELSRQVAKGNYSFINQNSPEDIQEGKGNRQDKVGQLMTEFTAMVQGVREREDELKEQVQKLSLRIDDGKRKQEVEEIINTDFYAALKKQAKKLRAQRKDKK